MPSVLTLTVAQIVTLTAAGVTNVDILADVDFDPDFLNDADKLGLGNIIPDPSSPLNRSPSH